jgi:hypothetical protein
MKNTAIWGCIAVLALLISSRPLSGQEGQIVSLSLKNVVDLAISQSSSVKYTQNQDVNYYWRWKNHQTRFRPQLTLSGDLPNFENETKPIVQPDGSIIFNQVTQLETSAQLAISQPIPSWVPPYMQHRALCVCRTSTTIPWAFLVIRSVWGSPSHFLPITG